MGYLPHNNTPPRLPSLGQRRFLARFSGVVHVEEAAEKDRNGSAYSTEPALAPEEIVRCGEGHIRGEERMS